MASWILVPCLVQLRTEFNRIAPSRDKASDGSIGDAAHQQSVSDHNDDEVGSVPIHDADSKHEVHAIDVDVNLRESDLTMERVVQFLLARCRAGTEKRLRYIIFNRRIWSASSGWVQQTYTGSSPHTEHAHFSASYETAREASTASWHLEDIPVALTAADKTWLTNTMKAQAEAAVRAQLDDIAKAVNATYRIPGTNTVGSKFLRNHDDIARDLWFATILGSMPGDNPIPADGELPQILTEVAEVSAKIDEIVPSTRRA